MVYGVTYPHIVKRFLRVVEQHEKTPSPHRFQHLSIWIVLHAFHGVNGQIVNQIHLSRKQSRNPRRTFRNNFENDPIRFRKAYRRNTARTAEIIFKTLHDNGIPLSPFNQFIGACAVDFRGHTFGSHFFNESLADNFLKWKHSRENRPGIGKFETDSIFVHDCCLNKRTEQTFTGTGLTAHRTLIGQTVESVFDIFCG